MVCSFYVFSGYPKLDEVNVFFHKHNFSLQYMYGKGITATSNISTILSPKASSYQGFRVEDELYIINSFLNSKMLFRKSNRYHVIKDSIPANLIDFGDTVKNTRYGIGVRVMDFYWVTGGSVLSQHQGNNQRQFLNSVMQSFCLGIYGFIKTTILWSIKKSKWLQGPRLPFMTGIEESCATLVNRSVVMIVGMTRLDGRYVFTYDF